MLAALVAPLGAGARSEIAVAPRLYPPCLARDVAGLPWTHRAYGRDIPGVAIRNLSLATCSIWGFPKIRVYDIDDSTIATTLAKKTLFDKNPNIVYAIEPAQAAFFAFYGHAGNGPFDRSCALYNRIAVFLASDPNHGIDVTMNAGTCGKRFTVSQIFTVAELRSRLDPNSR